MIKDSFIKACIGLAKLVKQPFLVLEAVISSFSRSIKALWLKGPFLDEIDNFWISDPLEFKGGIVSVEYAATYGVFEGGSEVDLVYDGILGLILL